jgi:hypothetical protein
MFTKAINDILPLFGGMPELYSIGLVGNFRYSPSCREGVFSTTQRAKRPEKRAGALMPRPS